MFSLPLRQPPPPLSINGPQQMGMWSRPSKRVPEVGQVGLFSPTSPRQFFNSNTSTISVDVEAAVSSAGAASALQQPGLPGGDLEMGQEGDSGGIADKSCLLSQAATATPVRSVGGSSATMAGGTPVAPSPGNISAVSAGEGVEALLLVRALNGAGLKLYSGTHVIGLVRRRALNCWVTPFCPQTVAFNDALR